MAATDGSLCECDEKTLSRLFQKTSRRTACVLQKAHSPTTDFEAKPMKYEFPAAVPEIPVSDMNAALDYYEHKLGFGVDWCGADGGIAGISKGQCRMFLTDRDFRKHHGNAPPVM